MTDVAQQNPVGITQQNDFREQRITPAAEKSTWEKSTSDRTPRTPVTAGVEPGTDRSAYMTVAGTIGAALDGTHGLTDPLRLLSDDPTRRAATITSFSTAQCYLAASQADFQGFAARVAQSGLNAVPMPGMLFVESNLVELASSREVWVMLIGNAGVNAWCSVIIDRSTRSKP